MKTNVIFKESKADSNKYSYPDTGVYNIKLSKFLDEKFIRKKIARLPQLSESQIVRHFSNLSIKNHHVDKNFYPLGSCTMKYNPKINDSIAMLDGFAKIHPEQNADSIQGILKVYHDLGKYL